MQRIRGYYPQQWKNMTVGIKNKEIIKTKKYLNEVEKDLESLT
jgi:hypothetical protein